MERVKQKEEYQMKQILIATHGKTSSRHSLYSRADRWKNGQITTIRRLCDTEDNEKKFEEYFLCTA